MRDRNERQQDLHAAAGFDARDRCPRGGSLRKCSSSIQRSSREDEAKTTSCAPICDGRAWTLTKQLFDQFHIRSENVVSNSHFHDDLLPFESTVPPRLYWAIRDPGNMEMTPTTCFDPRGCCSRGRSSPIEFSSESGTSRRRLSRRTSRLRRRRPWRNVSTTWVSLPTTQSPGARGQKQKLGIRIGSKPRRRLRRLEPVRGRTSFVYLRSPCEPPLVKYSS